MSARLVPSLLALLVLGACNQQAPTPSAKDGSPANIAQASADPHVAAASEAFEQLTEGAFSKDAAKVNSLVSAALVAGRTASDALPPPDAETLKTNVAAIEQAYNQGTAADLAIASNEAYLTAVSAIGGERTVPLAVSLLDYAGFRVTADLQADPKRWPDMAEAVAFAEQQWASLKDTVPDKAVAKDFDATLAALDKSVALRDTSGVADRVATELDQVDLLEKAFSSSAG